MPQARTVSVRETIDLVAPWYGQKRLPKEPNHAYVTLRQRKKPKLDEEGKPTGEEEVEWFETLKSERFAEHITVYRHLSHGDAKWVARQATMVKSFTPSRGTSGIKIDEAAMARLRTMGYLRRVVEITNAAGEAQPHATESDFDAFDEADLQFLDAAIQALDDPTVPILQEDIAAANEAAERIASLEARGFVIPPEQQVGDVLQYAAHQAEERLFRNDLSHLPEPGESA